MKYIENFGMMWAAFALIGLLIGMICVIMWAMWQWTVTRVLVIFVLIAGVCAFICTLWEYFQDKQEEINNISGR